MKQTFITYGCIFDLNRVPKEDYIPFIKNFIGDVKEEDIIPYEELNPYTIYWEDWKDNWKDNRIKLQNLVTAICKYFRIENINVPNNKTINSSDAWIIFRYIQVQKRELNKSFFQFEYYTEFAELRKQILAAKEIKKEENIPVIIPEVQPATIEKIEPNKKEQKTIDVGVTVLSLNPRKENKDIKRENVIYVEPSKPIELKPKSHKVNTEGEKDIKKENQKAKPIIKIQKVIELKPKSHKVNTEGEKDIKKENQKAKPIIKIQKPIELKPLKYTVKLEFLRNISRTLRKEIHRRVDNAYNTIMKGENNDDIKNAFKEFVVTKIKNKRSFILENDSMRVIFKPNGEVITENI